MKIVINNNGKRIPATLEVVDGVMIVSPKEEKVDITQFKDGDVVALDSGINAQLFLFKEWCNTTSMLSLCYAMLDDETGLYINEGTYFVNRIATEEEKEKLFKAIKDNGYRWNFHAKRLEKLIIPNFKKGDKVRVKKGVSEPRIIDDVCDTFYTLIPIGSIDFTDQDKWELVPNKFDINTLKPFESRVLVRDTPKERWYPKFFACLCDSNDCPYMVVGGDRWGCCIPFEGNEHLMNSFDDCDEYYKTWE